MLLPIESAHATNAAVSTETQRYRGVDNTRADTGPEAVASDRDHSSVISRHDSKYYAKCLHTYRIAKYVWEQTPFYDPDCERWVFVASSRATQMLSSEFESVDRMWT